MPGLLPDVDPDGLLEYSVVYTDRAIIVRSIVQIRVRRPPPQTSTLGLKWRRGAYPIRNAADAKKIK